MAIVQCACGKKSVVADSLMGTTVRCPKCGGDIDVGSPAAPAAVGKTKSKSKAKPDGAKTSGLVVSPTLITGGIIVTVLLIAGLSLYFGPMRVSNNWAAMQPQANKDVTDVVEYSIKAYESQRGMYDPKDSHMTPRADGDATFINPIMAFHMPEKIVFRGKTNQGNYVGTYDTGTHEVIADIEYGGYSVGGLVDINKAAGKFHATGRVVDGVVTAESEGKPLQIGDPFHLP